MAAAWRLAAVSLCHIATAVRGAEDGASGKATWQVKVFRLPVGYCWNDDASSSTTARANAALALPASDASAERWTESMRTISGFIGSWCRKRHFEPPEGTLFLHDVANGTLAVRSTRRWLDEFQSLTDALMEKVPSTIGCSLEILQSDAGTIRAMLEDTADKHDHAAALRQLQAMAKDGRASVLRQFRIETRSGVRAVAHAGAEMSSTKSLAVDDSGRAKAALEYQLVGTTFEVDPVVGPGGWHVDLSVALEHHVAPPVRRIAAVGRTEKHRTLETPVTDYRKLNVTSCLAFHKGGTRVLGVWTPEGTPEFSRGDVMQVAFLGVNVIRALPAENQALVQMLNVHGRRAAPSLPAADGKTPAGMEVRVFKVPPDFLSAMGSGGGAPAAPADPFAPANSSESPMPNWMSASAVLKANGIDFPPGASAHFIAQTSQLVVTNTPKNLEMVDALTSELHNCRWRYLIANTLHVIEGEGEVLRRLAKDALTEADHGAIWKQVEALASDGRVKLLQTTRLETRSGQRVSFASGIWRTETAGMSFREMVDEPMAATGPVKQRLMHATFDSTVYGTLLEIDPVIGPDGWTVDLDFGLHHAFAPLVAGVPGASFDDKTLRIGVPAANSPKAKIRSSTRLTWGVTKLLGMWKPEGLPEFDGKDVMQAAFLRVHRAPTEVGLD
jgi:hypothetical protein